MDAMKAICNEVKKMQSDDNRCNYSSTLVDAIVSQIHNGVSISEMSSATGISKLKLKQWLGTGPQQVQIKRWGTPEKGFRLCFPDGSWIEGLSFEDLKLFRDKHAVS